MKIRHIVFKELWQRKSELLASFIAILLGIAMIVSIQTIGVSSKEKITDEMHNLGSNMLILPKGTKVSDYYTADFGEETIPEKYVNTLHTSEFSKKVHEMIPKLSAKINIRGKMVILTGVLPKDEFEKKPGWQMTRFFKGDKKIQPEAKDEPVVKESKESEELGVAVLKYKKKAQRKAFDSLGLREAMLGNETAQILGLKEGEELEIKGRHFRVSQVLEETGTADDIRIFIHLHTVQDILGKEKVVNAIEVVGCGCTKDLVKLGKDIEKILPGTKVITIRHIAQTQNNTINMMKKFSLVLLIIALIIGGASIANYMSANVYERRREIGTLLAIGATPKMILSIFLQKAILLGLTGGIIGYFAGTGLALFLGPQIIKVMVTPQPIFIVWSIAIAGVLNVVFSLIPAKKAANLDPAAILQEE